MESILKPEQRMYLILSLVSDLRDRYVGKEDWKTDYQIASRIYANAFVNLIRYGHQSSYEERDGVAFLTLGLDGRTYSCPARTVKNIMRSEFAAVEEKLPEILPLLEAEESRIAEEQKSRKRRRKAKTAEDGAHGTPQPGTRDATQGQPAETAGKVAQDIRRECKDATAQAAAQKPPIAAARTDVKAAEAPDTPKVPDIPAIPAVPAMPDGKDAAPEHPAKPGVDTGAAKATTEEPAKELVTQGAAQEPSAAGEDAGSHEDGPDQASGPLHKATVKNPAQKSSADRRANAPMEEGKAGTAKDEAQKGSERAGAEAAPVTQEGPGSGKLPEATRVLGTGEEPKGMESVETSGSYEGDDGDGGDNPSKEAGAPQPTQLALTAPHVFRKKEKREAEPPAVKEAGKPGGSPAGIAGSAGGAVQAEPERRPMGVLSRFLPKGKKQEVRNTVQAAPEPETPTESAEPDVIPQIMEETLGERICHTHYVMLKKTYGTQVVGPYMIQVWPTEVIEMHPDKVPSAIFVRAKAPNGTVICKTGDGHIKYVVLEIDRKQFNVFGFWENGSFITEVVMINTTASMYTMNEEVEKECPEQVSDAFLDQFRSREPRRPEFFVVPVENVSHGEPFVPIAAFARVGNKNYVISNKGKGNALRFTYANELSEISGRWEDGKFAFTIHAVEQE